MHIRHILAPAVLVLAVACGGDSPSEPSLPAKPNVTGTWTGSLEGATLQIILSHDTIQNGIAGSGTLIGSGFSVALVVQGNYAGNVASMTLSSEGYEPMNLTGTHSSNTMTGVVNGSGFQNAAVTLTR